MDPISNNNLTGGGSQHQQQQSQGWEAMGGVPGDGIAGTGQLYGGGMMSSSTPPTPTTSQTHASAAPTPGSITRFATPAMQQQQQPQPVLDSVGGSYVGRAAQAYASYPMPGTSASSSGGGMQSPYGVGSMPSAPPTSVGPYAAPAYSSQQGYGTPTYVGQQQHFPPQQQQPAFQSQAVVPPQQQQQPLTTTAASSYAARSAVPAPVASATASGSSYAARSAQAYASTPVAAQPNLQQWGSAATATTTPVLAATSAMNATGGGGSSYAARSAQAYATNTTPMMAAGANLPQQPQQHQQQQPYQQPYYSNVPQQQQQQQVQERQPLLAGQQQQPQRPQPSSYAARSAQQQQQASGTMYHPQQPPLQQPAYSAAASTLYGGSGVAPMTTPSMGGVPGQQPQSSAMYPQQQTQPVMNNSVYPTTTSSTTATPPSNYMVGATDQSQILQQRMLTDATRKVQEHAYYMKQAMDQKNLPVVLDRAAHMVGELGGPPHGQHHHSQQAAATTGNTAPSTSLLGPTNSGVSSKLNPKNYYELYMRALEEMPTFEEYLLNLVKQPLTADSMIQIVDTHHHVTRAPYTMRELYDCTQFCPRVVSRLYLQISAGSALIRSGEVGAKWVLKDLEQAVRCEQNPIRGLFLRNFLLTALRDKLPDTPPSPQPSMQQHPQAQTQTQQPEMGITTLDEGAAPAPLLLEPPCDESDKGTVQNSYEFILQNFMEMNKLWVRIQHLPGEGKNKDVRKRRERERNDLRILVGTNLVRLSQLECVTSKIYGEVILPQVLEHIVVCGDPLSQAYLMDCLVQVFPDEYHIETLPILLNVCPRLRDKVNIRTILQGLMDRLANYLAEEELLDESDTNQVKKTLARDSFFLFEDCVQKVYNARGPKLTSKEVIRLQTALLQFSVKCYPGNDMLISRCLGACVVSLRQANASYDSHSPEGTIATVPDDRVLIKALDEASVVELEKLLSIPLDTLALRVLGLDQYSALIGFLPWANRREVAINMLKAVDKVGSTPSSVREISELFGVIEPVIRDENTAVVADQHSVARASSLMAGLGVEAQPHYGVSFSDNDISIGRDTSKENSLVSKLVHLLDHESPDTLFEMLNVAKSHICHGGRHRASRTLVAVVFASVKLAQRLFKSQTASRTVPDSASNQGESSGQQGVVATFDVAAEPVTATGENVSSVGAAEQTTPVENASDVGASEDTTAVENVSGVGAAEETAPVEHASDVGASENTTTVENVAAHASTGEDKEVGEESGHLSGEPTATVDAIETNVEPDMSTGPLGDISAPSQPAMVAPIVSCRKVFIFIQETILLISKGNPEAGVKLYLEMSLTADNFAALSTQDDRSGYNSIAYELLSQAYSLYEDMVSDSKAQQRCIRLMVGTLLSSRSLSLEDYEGLTTKTAQFSAKVVKKPDQCQLVALCAYLFYPAESGCSKYSNPQRSLECLQRSLKLADASTSANPTHVQLFVDLLEHYLFFFEKKNPLISHNYISGLVALIKEHFSNLVSYDGGDARVVADAKGQFQEVVRYIKKKKSEEATSELFASVQIEGADS